MATKYVTKDNLEDILDGIEAKIPSDLSTVLGGRINRVKKSILSSPVTLYTHGGSMPTVFTVDDDPANYDALEFDVQFVRSSGTVYCETFELKKEALQMALDLSSAGTNSVMNVIHSTGSEAVKSNNLSYFFRATLRRNNASDPKEFTAFSSVGQEDQVSGVSIELIDVRGIAYTDAYNDTPIGTIISYMGNTPPDEYLACDGTTYSITDYWELAEFFKNQFGVYNKFGGDGTTTFAVPDLRGEFLRGTGTNGHAYQGSGASVGVHQSATQFPIMGLIGNEFHARGDDTVYASSAHFTAFRDAYRWGNDGVTGGVGKKISVNAATISNASATTYTARPTNTSILYCIKYTNSATMQPSNVYVTEEKRIGTWIDGKPLYQIAVEVTMPTTANVNTVVYTFPSTIQPDTCVGIEGYLVDTASNGRVFTPFNLTRPVTNNSTSFYYGEYVWFYGRERTDLNSFYITGQVGSAFTGRPGVLIIKYTKK